MSFISSPASTSATPLSSVTSTPQPVNMDSQPAINTVALASENPTLATSLALKIRSYIPQNTRETARFLAQVAMEVQALRNATSAQSGYVEVVRAVSDLMSLDYAGLTPAQQANANTVKKLQTKLNGGIERAIAQGADAQLFSDAQSYLLGNKQNPLSNSIARYTAKPIWQQYLATQEKLTQLQQNKANQNDLTAANQAFDQASDRLSSDLDYAQASALLNLRQLDIAQVNLWRAQNRGAHAAELAELVARVDYQQSVTKSMQANWQFLQAQQHFNTLDQRNVTPGYTTVSAQLSTLEQNAVNAQNTFNEAQRLFNQASLQRQQQAEGAASAGGNSLLDLFTTHKSTQNDPAQALATLRKQLEQAQADLSAKQKALSSFKASWHEDYRLAYDTFLHAQNDKTLLDGKLKVANDHFQRPALEADLAAAISRGDNTAQKNLNTQLQALASAREVGWAEQASATTQTYLRSFGEADDLNAQYRASQNNPAQAAQEWAWTLKTRIGSEPQTLQGDARTTQIRTALALSMGSDNPDTVDAHTINAILTQLDQQIAAYHFNDPQFRFIPYQYSLKPSEYGGGISRGVLIGVQDGAQATQSAFFVDTLVEREQDSSKYHATIDRFIADNGLPSIDGTLAVAKDGIVQVDAQGKIAMDVITDGARRASTYDQFSERHATAISGIEIGSAALAALLTPFAPMIGRGTRNAEVFMGSEIGTKVGGNLLGRSGARLASTQIANRGITGITPKLVQSGFMSLQGISIAGMVHQGVTQAMQLHSDYEHGLDITNQHAVVSLALPILSTALSLYSIAASLHGGRSLSRMYSSTSSFTQAKWANRLSWVGFVPTAVDVKKLTTNNHGEGLADSEQSQLWLNLGLNIVPMLLGHSSQRVAHAYQMHVQNRSADEQRLLRSLKTLGVSETASYREIETAYRNRLESSITDNARRQKTIHNAHDFYRRFIEHTGQAAREHSNPDLSIQLQNLNNATSLSPTSSFNTPLSNSLDAEEIQVTTLTANLESQFLQQAARREEQNRKEAREKVARRILKNTNTAERQYRWQTRFLNTRLPRNTTRTTPGEENTSPIQLPSGNAHLTAYVASRHNILRDLVNTRLPGLRQQSIYTPSKLLQTLLSAIPMRPARTGRHTFRTPLPHPEQAMPTLRIAEAEDSMVSAMRIAQQLQASTASNKKIHQYGIRVDIVSPRSNPSNTGDVSALESTSPHQAKQANDSPVIFHAAHDFAIQQSIVLRNALSLIGIHATIASYYHRGSLRTSVLVASDKTQHSMHFVPLLTQIFAQLRCLHLGKNELNSLVLPSIVWDAFELNDAQSFTLPTLNTQNELEAHLRLALNDQGHIIVELSAKTELARTRQIKFIRPILQSLGLYNLYIESEADGRMYLVARKMQSEQHGQQNNREDQPDQLHEHVFNIRSKKKRAHGASFIVRHARSVQELVPVGTTPSSQADIQRPAKSNKQKSYASRSYQMLGGVLTSLVLPHDTSHGLSDFLTTHPERAWLAAGIGVSALAWAALRRVTTRLYAKPKQQLLLSHIIDAATSGPSSQIIIGIMNRLAATPKEYRYKQARRVRQVAEAILTHRQGTIKELTFESDRPDDIELTTIKSRLSLLSKETLETVKNHAAAIERACKPEHLGTTPETLEILWITTLSASIPSKINHPLAPVSLLHAVAILPSAETTPEPEYLIQQIVIDESTSFTPQLSLMETLPPYIENQKFEELNGFYKLDKNIKIQAFDNNDTRNPYGSTNRIDSSSSFDRYFTLETSSHGSKAAFISRALGDKELIPPWLMIAALRQEVASYYLSQDWLHSAIAALDDTEPVTSSDAAAQLAQRLRKRYPQTSVDILSNYFAERAQRQYWPADYLTKVNHLLAQEQTNHSAKTAEPYYLTDIVQNSSPLGFVLNLLAPDSAYTPGQSLISDTTMTPSDVQKVVNMLQIAADIDASEKNTKSQVVTFELKPAEDSTTSETEISPAKIFVTDHPAQRTGILDALKYNLPAWLNGSSYQAAKLIQQPKDTTTHINQNNKHFDSEIDYQTITLELGGYRYLLAGDGYATFQRVCANELLHSYITPHELNQVLSYAADKLGLSLTTCAAIQQRYDIWLETNRMKIEKRRLTDSPTSNDSSESTTRLSSFTKSLMLASLEEYLAPSMGRTYDTPGSPTLMQEEFPWLIDHSDLVSLVWQLHQQFPSSSRTLSQFYSNPRAELAAIINCAYLNPEQAHSIFSTAIRFAQKFIKREARWCYLMGGFDLSKFDTYRAILTTADRIALENPSLVNWFETFVHATANGANIASLIQYMAEPSVIHNIEKLYAQMQTMDLDINRDNFVTDILHKLGELPSIFIEVAKYLKANKARTESYLSLMRDAADAQFATLMGSLAISERIGVRLDEKIKLCRNVRDSQLRYSIFKLICTNLKAIPEEARLGFLRGINVVIEKKVMLQTDNEMEWELFFGSYVPMFGFTAQRELVLAHREVSTASSANELTNDLVDLGITQVGAVGLAQLGEHVRVLKRSIVENMNFAPSDIVDPLRRGIVAHIVNFYGDLAHGRYANRELDELCSEHFAAVKAGRIASLDPAFFEISYVLPIAETIQLSKAVQDEWDNARKLFSFFFETQSFTRRAFADTFIRIIRQEIVTAKARLATAKQKSAQINIGHVAAEIERIHAEWEAMRVSNAPLKQYTRALIVSPQAKYFRTLTLRIALADYLLSTTRNAKLAQYIKDAHNAFKTRATRSGSVRLIKLQQMLRQQLAQDFSPEFSNDLLQAFDIKQIDNEIDVEDAEVIVLRSTPSRGVIAELAASIGNYCISKVRDLLLRTYPSVITPRIFSAELTPAGSHSTGREFVGSSLILENAINGQDILVIRPINAPHITDRYDIYALLYAEILTAEVTAYRRFGENSYVVAPLKEEYSISENQKIREAIQQFSASDVLTMDRQEDLNRQDGAHHDITSKVCRVSVKGLPIPDGFELLIPAGSENIIELIHQINPDIKISNTQSMEWRATHLAIEAMPEDYGKDKQLELFNTLPIASSFKTDIFLNTGQTRNLQTEPEMLSQPSQEGNSHHTPFPLAVGILPDDLITYRLGAFKQAGGKKIFDGKNASKKVSEISETNKSYVLGSAVRELDRSVRDGTYKPVLLLNGQDDVTVLNTILPRMYEIDALLNQSIMKQLQAFAENYPPFGLIEEVPQFVGGELTMVMQTAKQFKTLRDIDAAFRATTTKFMDHYQVPSQYQRIYAELDALCKLAYSITDKSNYESARIFLEAGIIIGFTWSLGTQAGAHQLLCQTSQTISGRQFGRIMKNSRKKLINPIALDNSERFASYHGAIFTPLPDGDHTYLAYDSALLKLVGTIEDPKAYVDYIASPDELIDPYEECPIKDVPIELNTLTCPGLVGISNHESSAALHHAERSPSAESKTVTVRSKSFPPTHIAWDWVTRVVVAFKFSANASDVSSEQAHAILPQSPQETDDHHRLFPRKIGTQPALIAKTLSVFEQTGGKIVDKKKSYYFISPTRKNPAGILGLDLSYNHHDYLEVQRHNIKIGHDVFAHTAVGQQTLIKALSEDVEFAKLFGDANLTSVFSTVVRDLIEANQAKLYRSITTEQAINQEILGVLVELYSAYLWDKELFIAYANEDGAAINATPAEIRYELRHEIALFRLIRIACIAPITSEFTLADAAHRIISLVRKRVEKRILPTGETYTQRYNRTHSRQLHIRVMHALARLFAHLLKHIFSSSEKLDSLAAKYEQRLYAGEDKRSAPVEPIQTSEEDSLFPLAAQTELDILLASMSLEEQAEYLRAHSKYMAPEFFALRAAWIGALRMDEVRIENGLEPIHQAILSELLKDKAQAHSRRKSILTKQSNMDGRGYDLVAAILDPRLNQYEFARSSDDVHYVAQGVTHLSEELQVLAMAAGFRVNARNRLRLRVQGFYAKRDKLTVIKEGFETSFWKRFLFDGTGLFYTIGYIDFSTQNINKYMRSLWREANYRRYAEVFLATQFLRTKTIPGTDYQRQKIAKEIRGPIFQAIEAGDFVSAAQQLIDLAQNEERQDLFSPIALRNFLDANANDYADLDPVDQNSNRSSVLAGEGITDIESSLPWLLELQEWLPSIPSEEDISILLRTFSDTELEQLRLEAENYLLAVSRLDFNNPPWPLLNDNAAISQASDDRTQSKISQPESDRLGDIAYQTIKHTRTYLPSITLPKSSLLSKFLLEQSYAEFWAWVTGTRPELKLREIQQLRAHVQIAAGQAHSTVELPLAAWLREQTSFVQFAVKRRATLIIRAINQWWPSDTLTQNAIAAMARSAQAHAPPSTTQQASLPLTPLDAMRRIAAAGGLHKPTEKPFVHNLPAIPRADLTATQINQIAQAILNSSSTWAQLHQELISGSTTRFLGAAIDFVHLPAQISRIDLDTSKSYLDAILGIRDPTSVERRDALHAAIIHTLQNPVHVLPWQGATLYWRNKFLVFHGESENTCHIFALKTSFHSFVAEILANGELARRQSSTDPATKKHSRSLLVSAVSALWQNPITSGVLEDGVYIYFDRLPTNSNLSITAYWSGKIPATDGSPPNVGYARITGLDFGAIVEAGFEPYTPPGIKTVTVVSAPDQIALPTLFPIRRAFQDSGTIRIMREELIDNLTEIFADAESELLDLSLRRARALNFSDHALKVLRDKTEAHTELLDEQATLTAIYQLHLLNHLYPLQHPIPKQKDRNILSAFIEAEDQAPNMQTLARDNQLGISELHSTLRDLVIRGLVSTDGDGHYFISQAQHDLVQPLLSHSMQLDLAKKQMNSSRQSTSITYWQLDLNNITLPFTNQEISEVRRHFLPAWLLKILPLPLIITDGFDSGMPAIFNPANMTRATSSAPEIPQLPRTLADEANADPIAAMRLTEQIIKRMLAAGQAPEDLSTLSGLALVAKVGQRFLNEVVKRKITLLQSTTDADAAQIRQELTVEQAWKEVLHQLAVYTELLAEYTEQGITLIPHVE